MNTCYRILKFSPAPEFLDPINVALIISNGRTSVYYDKTFRRLRGVAPSIDIDSMDFLVHELNQEIADKPIESIDEQILATSSQMSLSEVRPLLTDLNESVVNSLIASYLLPVGKRLSIRQSPEEHYVDTYLHDFLQKQIRVDTSKLLKRALLTEFLSSPSIDLMGRNGMRIRRVFPGRRGIILVDAINLELTSRRYLDWQADNIAYAYYRVGKFRPQLEGIEHRFIRRASVVFGMDKIGQNPHFEYHVEKLRRDSDLLTTPQISRSVDELLGSFKEADGVA